MRLIYPMMYILLQFGMATRTKSTYADFLTAIHGKKAASSMCIVQQQNKRQKKMRIFTIDSAVSEGAKVETLEINGANVSIPVIYVGESGRGSKLGSVPVHLLPAQHAAWQRGETVVIYNCTMGQTKSGRHKIIETPGSSDNQAQCMVVFRTPIGFRGSNSHTGGRAADYSEENRSFLPFPGNILASGVISQGAAGRMVSGDQYVAIMPKDIIFRTSIMGRLYGAEGVHYHVFNGETILRMTPEEMEIADLI